MKRLSHFWATPFGVVVVLVVASGAYIGWRWFEQRDEPGRLVELRRAGEASEWVSERDAIGAVREYVGCRNPRPGELIDDFDLRVVLLSTVPETREADALMLYAGGFDEAAGDTVPAALHLMASVSRSSHVWDAVNSAGPFEEVGGGEPRVRWREESGEERSYWFEREGCTIAWQLRGELPRHDEIVDAIRES